MDSFRIEVFPHPLQPGIGRQDRSVGVLLLQKAIGRPGLQLMGLKTRIQVSGGSGLVDWVSQQHVQLTVHLEARWVWNAQALVFLWTVDHRLGKSPTDLGFGQADSKDGGHDLLPLVN